MASRSRASTPRASWSAESSGSTIPAAAALPTARCSGGLPAPMLQRRPRTGAEAAMSASSPSRQPKNTAAPDPNTRKPRFVMPPLACDAHCHVFGPAAAFPYDPAASYHPPDAPVEGLWRLHEILGIQRAVIVHASCHGPDMRATLDAIARSAGRYRGTAIIDPSVSEKDLERMHEGGIRGVRFNF